MLINSPNISGSLTITGNSVISGSLTVLGGITGAITGSAATASYVEYTNVANKPALVSSSAQITGYGIFATTGSNQFNGNTTITGSLIVTTGSNVEFQVTNTGVTLGNISTDIHNVTGSFNVSGSTRLNGNTAVTGSLTVTGQVVAQTLNVQQVTSSIVYSSGSNVFGNSVSNTQQFTGSLQVSGSSHYLLGSVGIGTNGPSERLEILGPDGSGAAVRWRMAGGRKSGYLYSDSAGVAIYDTNLNDAGIYLAQNAQIDFRVSGSQRMIITSGGNVGIGTTSIAASSGYKMLRINGATTGGEIVLAGNEVEYGYIYANSGNFVIDALASQPMRFRTGAQNRMDITSAGNVGIGTDSISNGTAFGGGGQINRLKVQSTNYTCLEINGSTSGGSIQFTYGTNLPNQVAGLIGYNYGSGTVNDFAISNVLSGNLIFGTNNTERMRIMSGGAIGMGQSAGGTPLRATLVKQGTTSVTFTATLGTIGAWRPGHVMIRVSGGQNGLQEYWAAWFYVRIIAYFASSVICTVVDSGGETSSVSFSSTSNASSPQTVNFILTDSGGTTNNMIADIDLTYNEGIVSLS